MRNPQLEGIAAVCRPNGEAIRAVLMSVPLRRTMPAIRDAQCDSPSFALAARAGRLAAIVLEAGDFVPYRLSPEYTN
jgi:hypothetical protein